MVEAVARALCGEQYECDEDAHREPLRPGDRVFVGGWPTVVLDAEEATRTVRLRISGKEGAPL